MTRLYILNAHSNVKNGYTILLKIQHQKRPNIPTILT